MTTGLHPFQVITRHCGLRRLLFYRLRCWHRSERVSVVGRVGIATRGELFHPSPYIERGDMPFS